MSTLFDFLSNYFLEGIMLIVLGIVTKIALKYLSNDRIDKIKEGILEAMLYAEEAFGIGQGSEKWTLAWRTLIKILEKQSIALSDTEQEQAKTLMKATIPEINQITYSSLPSTEKLKRDINFRNPKTKNLVENLKKKYSKVEKHERPTK